MYICAARQQRQVNRFFDSHDSIGSSGMAVNLDRQFLQKVHVRVIIGLLHEELQCRTCGARWSVGEPLPVDYWRCPNGCNANYEKTDSKR
jgi:hypothetical protein